MSDDLYASFFALLPPQVGRADTMGRPLRHDFFGLPERLHTALLVVLGVAADRRRARI